MRSEEIEKEMKEFLSPGEEIDNYIPVHDGEIVVGVVKSKDVSKTSSYGAWVGVERLIGFVDYDGERIIVVSDGNYDYGRADSAIDENEEKRFDAGELIWNSKDCCVEELEEEEE